MLSADQKTHFKNPALTVSRNALVIEGRVVCGISTYLIHSATRPVELTTRPVEHTTRPVKHTTRATRCLPVCTGTLLFNEGKNRSYLTLHTTFVDLVRIVPDPRVPVHTGKHHVAGSCVQLVESVCSTGRVVSSTGRVVVWSITRYLFRILPFRGESPRGL